MDLRLRPADYVDQAAQRTWGDTSRPEVVADLVRAEVTARGSCTRWATVQRIARAASVEPAIVDEICRQLEAEGDFSTASGGVLHVSPVRLVSSGNTEYRVVCSLPTARLSAKLPGAIDAQGVRRFLRLSEDAPALKKAVSKIAGIVLTPEQWAGLDLAPRADDAWLRAVDERLRWLPEGAGSLERDGALDWRGLTLTDDGPRYRRDAAAAQLWRSRSAFGRWLFVWGAAGVSPAEGDFVSLTSDDANRTMFAVARAAGSPIRATLTRAEAEAVLVLDAWLPRAEYRYLAMIGAPSGENHKNTWSIPTARVDDVVATLKNRLGLDITEEVGG
jgi:hypothetical protein